MGVGVDGGKGCGGREIWIENGETEREKLTPPPQVHTAVAPPPPFTA